MKRKSGKSPNNTFTLFCEKIVAIEEECFSGMDLTDRYTFPLVMIKRAKLLLYKIFIFHVSQNDAYVQFQ